jgi:glucose/arabinose dehydrogenase
MRMRLRLRLVIAVLALLAGAGAPVARAGTPTPGFDDVAVVSGLSSPTALAFLPNGRDMLVTEQGGGLKLVSGGAATTLATIPVCTASEMGLLGVAIDPGFSGNGFVYLYRTNPGPTGCGSSSGRFNQVVRVTMSGGTVDIGSLTVLLSGIQTDNGNHDGGGLRIGPDGKLWASVGDTGLGDSGPPGASTNPYAQDLGSLNGKILRLELSGAPAAGNPFIGQMGKRPEIYAYGLRNPFRFGFDPLTGKAWMGDVGQSTIEELDIVAPGGNYAWPRCEGTLPAGCQQPGDIDPIFEYPSSGATSLGRTIIGGAFAPQGFSSYGGQYFFADYIASKIYRAVPNAARDDIAGTPSDFVTGASGPVDVVFGPHGGLYYSAINSGEVREVTPNYARPRGATPLRASLVVAYRPCGSPNRMHGPPLAVQSCNPPAPESSALTVGTADANGETAKFAGYVRLDAVPGDPATPADEADVRIAASLSDVRRSASLSDYTGELQARLPLRITDKSSSPPGGSAATTEDASFAVTVPCVPTVDATVGSACAVSTTANTVLPGVVKEQLRSIWEIRQVEVLDGGPDGLASTADNSVFARQGLFAP